MMNYCYYETFDVLSFSEKSLTIVFPREMQGNKTLNDNIEKLAKRFSKYIANEKIISDITNKMENIYFDADKADLLKELKIANAMAYEFKNDMNENLFPYYWNIHEYSNKYILALEKNDENYDE